MTQKNQTTDESSESRFTLQCQEYPRTKLALTLYDVRVLKQFDYEKINRTGNSAEHAHLKVEKSIYSNRGTSDYFIVMFGPRKYSAWVTVRQLDLIFAEYDAHYNSVVELPEGDWDVL